MKLINEDKIKKKKWKNGLSIEPFIKHNAGDVEAGINFFNSAMTTGNIGSCEGNCQSMGEAVEENNSKDIVDSFPTREHLSYVLHNIIDWTRDYSPKDLSNIEEVAVACNKYDDDHSINEYIEAIEYYDAFDNNGNVTSLIESKDLKENKMESKHLYETTEEGIHVFEQEPEGFDIQDWYWEDEGLNGKDDGYGLLIIGNRDFKDMLYTGSYDEREIKNAFDESENKEEFIEKLKEITGKDYEHFGMTGYSQSDWQDAYYPKGEFSNESLREIEDVYMGKYDSYYDTTEDVGGYIVYHSSSDSIKKQLSEQSDIPEDKIKVRVIKGYHRVPDYEDIDESLKEDLNNVVDVEDKSREVVDPGFASAVRSIRSNDKKRDELKRLRKAPKEGEEAMSSDTKITLDESLFVESNIDRIHSVFDDMDKFDANDKFDTDVDIIKKYYNNVEVSDFIDSFIQWAEDIDEKAILTKIFSSLAERVGEFIGESLNETATKPNGDKVTAYNKAVKLAKKLGKNVVYGYTTSKFPGKFFEIDPREYDGDDSAFRKQYKAKVIYVAYPNDEEVEG